MFDVVNEELKKRFATGSKPTGKDFSDLIDTVGQKGEKGDPGVQGIQGKPGPQGEPGKDGLGYEEVSEEFKKVTAQLEHKVGDGVKANLEDLSAEVLSAIEGGEGTTFNLLSEPQDDSVTPQKLNPQLRDDLTFLIKNEFKNADFSDSTNEWGTNSTSTIVANQNEVVVTLSGTTTYSRISQKPDFIVGNKYYYAFEINPKYPNNTGIRVNSTNLEIINPEANKWTRYSSIYESDSTKNDGVWAYHTTTNGYSVGDSFKFRRMVSIDLTKSFGKGKEPTKNYMDALLNERFYNSFFTGEKNVVSLRQIFDDVSENKVALESLETEINNNGPMSSDKQEILIENGTYWEDFTFVDGDIWGFSQSDGQLTLISDLNIFDSDFTLKKKLKHNFGHCNSVDYNHDTDSLIFGNGGQSYDTDGIMYVVQQVKSWVDLPTDTLLDINSDLHGGVLTRYEFGNQFGSKINAIWSHDNLGRNDLCYVLSNDNKNIRQLLLGKGQNVLENGTAISGRLSDEFNGTYKVVSEWVLPPLTVNQGSCFYNGFVYVSLGHDGIWSARIELKSDGSSNVVERKLDYYNADGSEDVKTSAGIAVHKGKIYQGYRGGGSKLARFPIF